ncbi:hypothetical protein C7271_05790 [filamentous cyanobacterium CCP5]|nr:hypothetical protein C7271_05790 [filamentous cyanobacterium CCP5]
MIQQLFPGASQAAALMRSHDWAQTPMGPADHWPAPLKTALGILLGAGTPMVCIWGPDRRLFYNDAWAHLLEADRLLPIGQAIVDQSAAIGAPLAEAVESVFATGQLVASVAPSAAHSFCSDYVWDCSPIWQGDGHIGGVFVTGAHRPEVGIFQDSTSCQRVTVQLEESQHFIQHVAATLPGILYVYDLVEQRNIYVNRQVSDLLGYSEVQLQTMGENLLSQVIHPDDFDRIATHHQQFQSVPSGENREIVYRMHHSSGEWRWFRSREVVFARTPGGQPRQILGIAQDITHHHQAETTARESEARFRLIAETIQDVFWITDFQHPKILYVSPAYETIWGRSPDAIYQDHSAWAETLHPDDRDRVVSQTSSIPDHGQVEQDYRIIRPDGAVRWIRDRGFAVRDQSGAIQMLVGIAQDITERRHTEQALQQAEERLRIALQHAPITMFNQDQNLTYTWIYNSQVLQPDSVVGKGDRDILDPLTAETMNALKRQVLATGVGIRQEIAATIRGSRHFFDLTLEPLRDTHGAVVGLTGAAINISDLKRTELELRQSEERFRDLADNISQFAWMANPDGSIFWYNRRWFDYTGTTLEAMQGWGWQQVHHPDHVERVVEKFSRCIASGDTWEDTFPIRSQDGKYRWFLSRAVPVRDDQGHVLRWFGTNTDITELRDTELALQQATDRLNTALKSAPITLFNQDRELRYTWLHNPTHDFSRDGVLGQRDDEILPAELATPLIRLKQQVLDKGVGVRSEVKVDPLYFDLTVDPIHDQHGAVVGITCAAVDISQRLRLEAERQQAEDTLRQSEDRLRMAVESAQLGTWDWNLVTNELVWDSGCKAMFGLAPDAEVTIEGFYEGLHPDDRPPVERVIRDCFDPTLSNHYNIDYRTVGLEDGVERWISAKGKVYFDASDTPQRFTGIVVDISDRKRFEQALMESEAIARTNAEELAALMETTPAAIWIAHDPDCHQMTANRMAYELMGSEPGASATATPASGESSLLFKQFKNGEEMRPQDLPMQKAIRTQQEVTDQIEFVFPDGTVRYLYGRAVPLYGPNGGVRGAIGGFAEITAFKEAEQEREQLLQRERLAREEAERANRIKDDFLAVLSHELRSPLNPILGWSRLLRMGRLDRAKTEKALETIERNAQLQAQLVDDLLDLARILRGKLHLESTVVSLAQVVESAVETVKMAAAAKAISLTADLDATIRVLGDAGRLQQIVWNLVSNAIKFTPDHGQIQIQLTQTGHQAQIIVTDTGVGITPDFLPFLFESFRQEDVSITRKHGGLGLGLAIVRRLVEAHGGTITADSPGEGQGATFTVQLPSLSADGDDPLPAPVSAQIPDLAGLKILAVDDSADARELLTALLTQYGAEVAVAGSAAAALETAKRFCPDLLISDIGMPDMDGYELIRQIRSLAAEPVRHIPAIALTAYAREDDQQRAIASGYQRHLSKPLNINQLVATINQLIQTPPRLS